MCCAFARTYYRTWRSEKKRTHSQIQTMLSMHKEQCKQEQQKKIHTQTNDIFNGERQKKKQHSYRVISCSFSFSWIYFAPCCCNSLTKWLQQQQQRQHQQQKSFNIICSVFCANGVCFLQHFCCWWCICSYKWCSYHHASIWFTQFRFRLFLSPPPKRVRCVRICRALVHICTHHHFCGKDMPHYSTTTESSCACVCVCWQNVHSFEKREKKHTHFRASRKNCFAW